MAKGFMKAKSAMGNARVARAYVEGQHFNGWLMARAQVIAVCLSGTMMFVGVILMYSGVTLAWDRDTLLKVLAAWPVAMVAAPVAVLIEGMNILASNGLSEAKRKIEQEMGLLNKTRKAYTEEEFRERERSIKKQRVLPAILLGVFMVLSLAGAEMFWHTLTEGKGLFFQVIGVIVGAVVSISLT